MILCRRRYVVVGAIFSIVEIRSMIGDNVGDIFNILDPAYAYYIDILIYNLSIYLLMYCVLKYLSIPFKSIIFFTY